MGALDKEIAIFESMKDDLEADYLHKWVVIHDDEFVGAYDTFQHAAEVAVLRYGRGPYLITQVGAPPVTLPASVLYKPIYADD